MSKPKDFNFIPAIMLVALGGFIFLCLISYNATDLAFFSSTPNDIPLNYGGVFGARVAFGLFLVFGPSAFVLPIVLFIAGIVLYANGTTPQCFARIACGLLLLPASAVYTGLLTPSSEKFSGIFAREIAERFLLVNLGKQGSLLAVSAITIVCAKFFLNITGQRLETAIKIPIGVVKSIISVIKTVVGWFRWSKTENDPTNQTKPTRQKRSRKSKQAQELPQEDDYSQDDDFIEPSAGKKDKSGFHQMFKSDTYVLPDLDLLNALPNAQQREIKEDLSVNSAILESTLKDFGIEAKVVGATKGPVLTCYELHPAPGVKVQKIVTLADDLALALKAISLRILAPIPGKAAVGIEVPNSKASMVYLKELLESESFKKNKKIIPLVLGKDISGTPLISDLTEMPHLLIAGSTGSGKTVAVNAIITGILFMADPEYIKFVMIDPKIVEMADYKDIPHLITPIINEPKKASKALQWLVREMERRYETLAKVRVRNIKGFNARNRANDPIPAPENDGENKVPDFMPYIVVVIDELADLMMAAPADIENSIVRLAQMSRAVGIHLLIATQRPSVDVLTGIIKANLPARIAFKVASKVDSRTILDANGADKLLGKGDLLFLPPGSAKLIRAQGALVQDEEIRNVVKFIKSQQPEEQKEQLEDQPSLFEQELLKAPAHDRDDYFDDAVQVVKNSGQPSVSMIQRKLRIGYTRAARIMDQMEEAGIVSAPDPVTKTRDLLTNF